MPPEPLYRQPVQVLLSHQAREMGIGRQPSGIGCREEDDEPRRVPIAVLAQTIEHRPCLRSRSARWQRRSLRYWRHRTVAPTRRHVPLTQSRTSDEGPIIRCRNCSRAKQATFARPILPDAPEQSTIPAPL